MSAHNLAPLDAIAALDGRKLVAGVNGGYFFRLDEANLECSVRRSCKGWGLFPLTGSIREPHTSGS
jgi:hypothetical protein